MLLGLFVILLLATTFISIALAFYAWQRRPAAGATHYAVLMLAVGVYSLAYAFELASVELSRKLISAKVEAVGIMIIPVAWFAFTLEFTGRKKWLTRRNLVLLLIVPGVALLLVWTNEFHGLMWSDAFLDASGPFPTLVLPLEPAAWFYGAYDTLLTLLGMGVLVQAFLRSSYIYRRQIGILLLAALLPVAGDLLSTVGLSFFPYFDMTPLAFTLTGLVMAWGLFRFRLLDLVPVARDIVIESMGDAVFVLDAKDRIVDLNPSAQELIGREAAEAIGQRAELLAGILPWLDGELLDQRGEIVRGDGELQRSYDLHISPLADRRGRLTGRLIVLRDITKRKQAEKALREAHDELDLRVQERTAELAQANEALRLQIAERERAENRLQTSLQEKDVLLQEIHHRVKNNLQVVLSLLYLQSKSIDDESSLDALRESRNRIYSMATIHEVLYQSGDLARVDFAQYTRKLIVHLFASYDINSQVIVPRTRITEASLSIDTAIPCGLIINELVSNSLKHAFPGNRGGEVCIELHTENHGQWILTISDNGIGLPPDVERRQRESLGLQLVTTLTQQLEGTIEVDCSEGTAYTIVF